MNLDTTTTFLGWCAVLNIGLLLFAVLVWVFGRDFFSKTGAKMFGVTEEELRVTVLRVLMQYRVGIVLFTVVPYLAMKLMPVNVLALP